MKADKYRTNAEYCQRMARLAARDKDRTTWQELADSWTNLEQAEMRLFTMRAELVQLRGERVARGVSSAA